MVKRMSRYPTYCFECEIHVIGPDSTDAEREVALIEHLKWEHFDEETIKANWAALAKDIDIIAGLVANDKWFESYLESGDIYDRILIALKGVRRYSKAGVDS
jgi:hypothetical protein